MKMVYEVSYYAHSEIVKESINADSFEWDEDNVEFIKNDETIFLLNRTNLISIRDLKKTETQLI